MKFNIVAVLIMFMLIVNMVLATQLYNSDTKAVSGDEKVFDARSLAGRLRSKRKDYINFAQFCCILHSLSIHFKYTWFLNLIIMTSIFNHIPTNKYTDTFHYMLTIYLM